MWLHSTILGQWPRTDNLSWGIVKSGPSLFPSVCFGICLPWMDGNERVLSIDLMKKQTIYCMSAHPIIDYGASLQVFHVPQMRNDKRCRQRRSIQELVHYSLNDSLIPRSLGKAPIHDGIHSSLPPCPIVQSISFVLEAGTTRQQFGLMSSRGVSH